MPATARDQVTVFESASMAQTRSRPPEMIVRPAPISEWPAAGGSISWEEVIAGFAQPVAESRISPDPELVALYTELKPVYEACEEHALGRGDDPRQKIEAFAQR